MAWVCFHVIKKSNHRTIPPLRRPGTIRKPCLTIILRQQGADCQHCWRRTHKVEEFLAWGNNMQQYMHHTDGFAICAVFLPFKLWQQTSFFSPQPKSFHQDCYPLPATWNSVKQTCCRKTPLYQPLATCTIFCKRLKEHDWCDSWSTIQPSLGLK